MPSNKIKQFPTYKVSIGDAWLIVKKKLDDDTIPYRTKVFAIENNCKIGNA